MLNLCAHLRMNHERSRDKKSQGEFKPAGPCSSPSQGKLIEVVRADPPGSSNLGTHKGQKFQNERRPAGFI